MSYLDLLIIAALCAGAAWTLLRAMEPGMLLSYWMNVLDKMNTHQSPDWQKLISKPLGYCGFCFTFWVALGFALSLGVAAIPSVLVSLAAVAIYSQLE